MKTNVKSLPAKTNEGAIAKKINPELQLRRSVMACMLFENTFYEDGVEISDRIKALIPKVKAEKVSEMAIEAREKMKLRHVPLLIVREMARIPSHKHLVADTLERVIQRPDELSEFVAIYWKDGRQPLSAQAKKGLAMAFLKFNEYSLAKYNHDGTVKLKDVLFLCHAKPAGKDQEALWKRLIEGKLKTPDTWEVALSAGEDKKKAWERLIKEGGLGALAFLRNLRNMKEANVSEEVVLNGLGKIDPGRVLPFRFISAARYAPQWEAEIEKVMMKCLEKHEKLPGHTVLLIDVSGSMDDTLSGKSEMTRVDAACGLAILLREICENVSIFTFSNKLEPIPARHGFALRDAIDGSQDHGVTETGKAVRIINNSADYDRLIIITDEQSHDSVQDPKSTGYVINVAPYKNGIGYGKWTHVDGFSEATVDYVMASEKED